MSKAVQHAFSPTEPLNRQPIVLLIQKETGLLTIYHINLIMNPILRDFHIRIKWRSDEILYLRQSFFFPFICIASLVHSTNHNAVLCQHFL